MAHSVSAGPRHRWAAGAEEPSVGTLVQSAMADVSTLVRAEVELAKAEIGKSAKKAGISAALFGAPAWSSPSRGSSSGSPSPSSSPGWASSAGSPT